MRAGEMRFGRYDVLLGDQEVHVVLKIGERGKPHCERLSPLIQAYVLFLIERHARRNTFVDHREIAFVPELLEVPTQDRFVLFR